jgi:hypothetical protein
MELATFKFQQGRWSVDKHPDWDSEQTLLLAFFSPRFGADEAAFADLRRSYPRSHLLGCSTAGEIIGREIFDDSIVVSVIRFERTQLRTAYASVGRAEDSKAAGATLASELAGPGLKAVFVVSDGTRVNGSHLVEGLNGGLPADVVVTGGLAGDGTAFGKTWVLRDGQPQDGVVAAVGLYGEHVRIGHGSKGGWDIFGPERVITRSRDHVLYELDGRPALDLYKEYLGERAAELPASALLFPLAIRANREDANRVVRTVLAVDDNEKNLTFAGNVPTGHLAQLMRANFDRLIDGAAEAAGALRTILMGSGPTLCIAVSCVGRRLVLGERAEEEVESVVEVMDSKTQQIGFYSYGELSPYTNGRCDLHNQTMTLTAIGEI